MIDALAWTLLHFLWQGALIGVAAFLLLRLARPERASTRYAIGVATLGVMLMTCLATFTILSKQTASPDRDVALIPIAGALSQSIAPVGDTVNEVTTPNSERSIIRTAPAAFATWRPAPLGPTASFVLVLAWGIGVLALSLRLLGGWLLTRSLTRHAISSVSPAIIAAAAANRLAREGAGRGAPVLPGRHQGHWIVRRQPRPRRPGPRRTLASDAAKRGQTPPLCAARSLKRCSLPVAVFGNSDTNSTPRGRL